MKSHHEDTPVSLLRRRLLCGLPSGLALATPLSLLGCGGGSEDESSDPVAEEDADVVAVREAVAKLAFVRSAQAVAVVLPPGNGVELAKTHLITANNVSQVAIDGTAGAVLLDGAPQMAYLTDDAGRLLLMGIVEPGVNTRIDARSTAQALILLASEAALAGDVPELALREALRTHPIVEPVQRAVEAALGRNGIDDADTGLALSIEDALRAMRRMPARNQSRRSRERALSVQPLPATPLSGVTVQPGPDYNTVQLSNALRRRLHVWISRIGYFDANGNPVQLPGPVAVKDFSLKATTEISFDTLVKRVGDIVAELLVDIGALDPYLGDPTFWTPVTSEPLALGVEPSAAQISVYQARVVGVGLHDGAPMTGKEGEALEELLSETFWEDIVKPLVKTVILPLISHRIQAAYKDTFKNLLNALLLATMADLAKLESCSKYFPDTIKHLRAGNAEELLFNFWKEFFGSSVWKKLFETALKGTIGASDGILVAPAYTDLQGNVTYWLDPKAVKASVDKLSAGLTKVSRIIMIIKAALTVTDYAAMAKDWAASSRVEAFTINVSKAKVSLSPNPAVAAALAGDAGKAAVTAAVTDLDGLFNPSNVFLEWRCTGRNGKLIRRGGEGINEFESPLDNATHDYFPNGEATPAQNTDTITVSAFYRDTTNNRRVEIGSVSVPVHIRKEFTLSVVPATGADVPADNTIGVSAAIKEHIPKDATVDWEWSHAGVGMLRSGPVDTNPSESSALLDTGSSEGAATITVRARINLPATSTTPARSVHTDAASVTLRVKKGLKTLTLQGSWISQTLYTPWVCNCGPGHSPLNYIAYEVGVFAVMPKVSGAKSYSALFEKPTPDVPGGVPFPHTRTLSPAAPGASWQERGGTWWSGMTSGGGANLGDDGSGPGALVAWNQSRFGDMKVTVTVTL